MENESVPKRRYLKWMIMVLGVVVLGLMLLGLTGEFLIREVRQDIYLEEPKQVAQPAIGKPAPNFELQDLSARKVNLADFYGSPLVLLFWSSWNTLATDQIKIMDDYLRVHGETLFKIITINQQEDRSVVENFLRRGGYRISVLLDETGEVGERFGIKQVPTTYFLDRQGIVEDIVIGVMDEKTLVDKGERIIR